MRLRAILFAILVLAGVGTAAYKLAEAATAWFESSTTAQLTAGLKAGGQTWADVAVDGLKVTLAGAAPDETSRFRALEAARQIVDEGRIVDATTLGVAALTTPPAFALELLRNEADISLIGLVPEVGGRDVIRAALGAGGLTDNVADMLESASDPAPSGWRESLGFGLSVLAQLPRAKISVTPGKVSVIALADSDPERAALEARLRGAAPDGVALTLDISAPRPVLSPFAFDFRLDDGIGRLAACSADSEEAAASILAVARDAGLGDAVMCAVGLGSPSPEWAAAVADGLEALEALGGGRFTLNDLAAELTGPGGATPERLTEVAAALDDALPDVFQLVTVIPQHMEAGSAGQPVYTPRFDATLIEDGTIRLAGAVQDATSRTAIDSFAAALFGHDRVVNATVLDPELPEGWPVKVLAGVEALAALQQGTLAVTSDRVQVTGWGLDEHVDDRVEALLAAKVGSGAVVEVSFNAEAAAAAELAARPRPEICADQINAILESGSIRFAAGSADIVPESAGVIAAIADVLRGCPGAEFEIAGHTDSQGPADVNRELSETRAAAVAAALEAEDLPLVAFSARGYGADRPVDDNATGPGRARNRRIEFILGPAPDPAPVEVAEAGDDAIPLACLDAAGAILADQTIEFDAGSAEIAEASGPVIEAIAEALAGCPDAAVEIGGHTDSQGSDSGNLRLSEQRAGAVLAALRSEDLPLSGFVSRGYGEADPIADNASADGRARNRRIALTPLPPAGAAAEPTPVADGAEAACIARIGAILAEQSIQFAPGSASIAGESAAVIAAISDALGACPEAGIEVAGYTDSEGSDSGNQRLSERRAEAVLAALRSADLPLPNLSARGYGEANPVADNGTAEGRAQNRRIAFEPVEAAEIGSDDGSQ